jgi:MFS family permease
MKVKSNPLSGKALQIYAITILFYSVVYMVLMVLPFYALTLNASKSDIGLIMGVTMLTSMITRPIAGNIIDRFGPKKVFLNALLIFAFSLLGYFIPHFWVFGLVRIIQGVVAACFSTAMEILTIELLSSNDRGQGLSLYSLATMIPSTFGPSLILLLKDIIPIIWIFGIFFIMGGINFLCAIFLSRHIRNTREIENKRWNHHRKRGLWKNRILIISSAIIMLASIANGAIFTFLPIDLEAKHSPYASVYFLTQTLVLVFSRFIGRKFVHSDGTISKKSILLLSFLAALGTMVISFYHTLPMLLLAAICNGVAFAMLYPSLLTFVSFSVPDHARGFLLGLFIGAADLGFSLGALAMGPLAEKCSFQVMYFICSVLCVVASFLIIFYKKGRDPQDFSKEAAI